MEGNVDKTVMEMDPIWLKHRDEILVIHNVIKNINLPLFSLPDGILDSLLSSFYSTKEEGYTNYSPLIEILRVLVYLLEVKEGAELAKEKIFSDRSEQQKLIRAFRLFIEDVYQRPDDEINELVYYKYREVFSILIKKLANLEDAIDKRTSPLPNIIGSLIMVFKHSCQENGIDLQGLNSDIIKSQSSGKEEELKKVYWDYKKKVTKALKAFNLSSKGDDELNGNV